jgi:hypothetical protein
VVVVGGVWGVLPDGHWVRPAGSSLSRSFHRSPWIDLFFLQGPQEEVDPSNSRTLPALVIVLVPLGTAGVEAPIRRWPERR